jgi:hypothetical protein
VSGLRIKSRVALMSVGPRANRSASERRSHLQTAICEAFSVPRGEFARFFANDIFFFRPILPIAEDTDQDRHANEGHHPEAFFSDGDSSAVRS